MTTLSDVTQQELMSLYSYDSNTGLFTRRVNMANNKFKAGSVVEPIINSRMHAQIKIRGKSYQIHRLAWLYVYGEWPNGWLDHINCNPLDNRISNLRIATPSQNKMNCYVRKDNSSGYKGVTWVPRRNRWVANCTTNKVKHQIGYFKNLSDAVDAQERYAREHHGEFYRAEVRP